MSSSVDFMLGKLVQISVRVLPSCGVWDQPRVFCCVSSFIILDDSSWFLENLFCHDSADYEHLSSCIASGMLSIASFKACLDQWEKRL